MNYLADNESETVAIATSFADRLKPGDVVALSGELGAGKSLFCRAVMRALGVQDQAMPSPTYAVIQEYDADGCRIAHMDWYRLDDAAEIEMLGVRDFFRPPWICLIEWPEQGEDILPDSAIRVRLVCSDDQSASRTIQIEHLRSEAVRSAIVRSAT